MQFEGLRRKRHSPNLTPLIDIVFLLLVFFMLTAHFVRDESIAIELPEAQSAVARDQDAALEVLIGKQGEIQVNGRIIDVADLQATLHTALQQRSKKWITLRGDRAANLGVTVAVLDAARKAGAESVDIVTQRP